MTVTLGQSRIRLATDPSPRAGRNAVLAGLAGARP